MIVRICDVASSEPRWDPATDFDACRILSYADLANIEPPPADRFEFYGLTQSWPARIRLAEEIEDRIGRSGGEVCNPPSALAGAKTPSEVARLLTPDLSIQPAIGGKGDLPCRLRAAYGGMCQESNWLETEREFDEILLDWVLSGTDPKLIFRVSTPSCPQKLGRGVRALDQLHLSTGLEEAAKAELIEQLDHSHRQLAAFDFWIEDGRPRLWRVDDSWAVMAGTPAVRRD